MPKRKEDKDTRYFIDVDLARGKILGWDYGQKEELTQKLAEPSHHRIFITKGQYNKFDSRSREVKGN